MDNKTLKEKIEKIVLKPEHDRFYICERLFELIQSERQAYANELIGTGEVVLSFDAWYDNDPHKGDFRSYTEQYLIPVITRNKLKEKLRQLNG